MNENSKPKTKNDAAWKELFKKYSISEEIENTGRYLISADQIREFREPRLMVKFDHGVNRPAIFIEKNLSILPVSRGGYVISDYKAYQSFKSSKERPRYFALPEHIQSLDADHIQSEDIAINCAFASGILSDFLGEEILYPTVCGRMNSGKFTFGIDVYNINRSAIVSVDNSQMEIDAAYEGSGCLALIEAKCDLSDDFMVRQLYYPFRLWHDQERITKHIRPVFLVYSNGVFNLYEYQFKNPRYYNSLALVQRKNYTIEKQSISMDDLKEILNHIQLVDEPKFPFPQANTFERVVNLCEVLSVKKLTHEEIAAKYTFVVRQSSYYTDAVQYLGLVKKYRDEDGNIAYSLTDYGQRTMKLKYRERQLEFCRAILKHPVFYKTFCRALDIADLPSKQEIEKFMKECHIKISGNTPDRRASSVRSWIKWMIYLTIQEE